MNEGKKLAEQCREYMDMIDSLPDTDKRCSELGKTNLQQGFMWAILAVARPETF